MFARSPTFPPCCCCPALIVWLTGLLPSKPISRSPHAGVTEDDNLPSNLKRNLTSLRELDQQSQELFERMQKLSKAHIARAKRSVQEGRDPEDDLLIKARKAYKELMELDEEKVQLADRMSAEINKHYDHCASELRKFEEELKEKGQLKTPQMKTQQLSRQDSAGSGVDDAGAAGGAGGAGPSGHGGGQPGDAPPGAVGAAGRRGRNTGFDGAGGGPPSGGNSHKRGRGRKVSFKEAERQRLLAEQEAARQQPQAGGDYAAGGSAPAVPMNYPDPVLPLATREESNSPLCGAVPAPADYTIAEGTKVCAKPPSTKMQPQDWILGTVVKYVAVTHKYVVQDEDDSDDAPWAGEGGSEAKTHNVPGRMVIPLPLTEPSHYTPYNEFQRGTWILALYPDTTCFYKALVHTQPSQMGAEPPRDYLVEFEDENEPTGRGEALRCPQRYVLALPS